MAKARQFTIDFFSFSGDMSPSLHLESGVENRRLVVGGYFDDKTILRMRVMEEANMRGILVKMV